MLWSALGLACPPVAEQCFLFRGGLDVSPVGGTTSLLTGTPRIKRAVEPARIKSGVPPLQKSGIRANPWITDIK